MNFKTADVDMLHGPLAKKLLLFTIPIALSSILQQLFNAADTVVVGYFGNKDALAAVGTNTEIIALIVAVSSGLSVGVNILVANLIGKNRKNEVADAVRTAVMLSVFIGVPGAALGQLAAEPLLRLIQTPDGILRDAVLYLRIYMLGYPFLLLYDFGSAVLRARGNSRYPFFVLAFSGAANVGLNLFFVIVFRMGVAGVAIATGISNMVSALTVLHRLSKENQLHSAPHKPRLFLKYTAKVLKTGVPSAVQGAVFCFANIFVQASANSFGETAIAGSVVAMNFEYFTYYLITAFGQTATTFSGLFTPDRAVIESAAVRILCILLFEPLCSLYEIPSGVLRGSGHALYPAVSTVIGTCAFRIIWIYTVFRANPTLSVLYYAFPLSWVFTVLFVNSGFLMTCYAEKVKTKSS